MARTWEERLALKERREKTDPEKLRKERRAAAGRARRKKLVDGELLGDFGFTPAELRGMRKDAQLPSLRKRWERLGTTEATSTEADKDVVQERLDAAE